MRTKRFGSVSLLPDNAKTGYGHSYVSGENLYVVCLVDCYFPSFYALRANSFEEAYYVAQECLSPTLESDYIAGAESEGWLTYTESGRPVSSDDDIRVFEFLARRAL